MKKLAFTILAASSLFLFSCQPQSGAKYQAVNRQKALFLIDQETGEVFMMSFVGEKGQGVVGSSWKSMGSPEDAE